MTRIDVTHEALHRNAEIVPRSMRQIPARAFIDVNLSAARLVAGHAVDQPVQLASVMKYMTAAALLAMGARFKPADMRTYLSRSHNDLGCVMAAEARGCSTWPNACDR